MCGIGAFHIVGGEFCPTKCARVLLRLLEVRGRDASGVAWHEESAGSVETMVMKGALKGSDLAKQIETGSIGSTGIVHTRWATQGSPSDNANNHPIDVAGLVGVHNGHVKNDRELFGKIDAAVYGRVGQVDSEAAFAWMAHGGEADMVSRMGKIQGNAALLWLETGDERQRLFAARLTSSPLVLGQTEKGSVILASTKAILDETAKRLEVKFDFQFEFGEGEMMVFEEGRISDYLEVPVERPTLILPTSVQSYVGKSKFEKEVK